jgi:hypothetical protein
MMADDDVLYRLPGVTRKLLQVVGTGVMFAG